MHKVNMIFFWNCYFITANSASYGAGALTNRGMAPFAVAPLLKGGAGMGTLGGSNSVQLICNLRAHKMCCLKIAVET